MGKSFFEKQVDASETFVQAFESILSRHGYEKSNSAYKKCQMSKQKFHYIRKGQHTSKTAVFHIALGLGFSFEETDVLLRKLGYGFSDCELRDVIVKFYLEDGNPDIYEVDEELRRYGLPCFIKEDEDAPIAA
jgi:hypothetical protein